MSTTSVHPFVDAYLRQFDLHTRLFSNVTADVSDAHARTRPSPSANPFAWIAGHTVSSRFMLANILGASTPEPFPELFAHGKGLVAEATYPTMQELTRDWPSITRTLGDRMRSITEAELQADAPFPTPVGKRIMDFIPFIMHHEAYMIGQMGILRRFFGYEAMKYN